MNPPPKKGFWLLIEAKVQSGPAPVAIAECVGVVWFHWTVLLPHFKGAQMFPTVLENKESSGFYSFLWSFYDVCGQINSWDVDTVLSVASACTATHTSALVTGSFFFFFFLKEKVDPRPCPLFLLGLRACQAHVIQEIPLLGPSWVAVATGTRTCRCRPWLLRTLASSSSFYCWEVFVVGVGGASGVVLRLFSVDELPVLESWIHRSPERSQPRVSLPPWYLITPAVFEVRQEGGSDLFPGSPTWPIKLKDWVLPVPATCPGPPVSGADSVRAGPSIVAAPPPVVFGEHAHLPLTRPCGGTVSSSVCSLTVAGLPH